MADADPAIPEPAFCPHCGAARAAWATFCPRCGNALDAPAERARSSPAAAPRPARPVREALITAGVLIAAACVVAAVIIWRGVPISLFPAPSVPPAGEIWFGDTYDAGTFEMHQRWTSVSTGRPISCVAHTPREIAADAARLRIDLDGTTLADQTLSSLSGPGDLIGFSFTPPAAGTYTFSIVGLDSSVLAMGSLPAQ